MSVVELLMYIIMYSMLNRHLSHLSLWSKLRNQHRLSSCRYILDVSWTYCQIFLSAIFGAHLRVIQTPVRG